MRFLGWPAHEVDNGLIRAVVVPDVGGRVMQFWLDDHPFLFVNQSLAGRLFSADVNWGDGTMASWKNYGGNKTWPAPQGWSGPDEWAGPPDPVLDSGHFKTLTADSSRVAVQSPPDPRTGLQITRELTLEPGAARAVLRRTMRNVSERPVRWSLWDVTQLDCAIQSACRMTIPLNASSRFPSGFDVLYGPRDNPQWRTGDSTVFTVEYSRALGKVALDSYAGWIAFSDGEWALLQQFDAQPGQDYPDGGATVEVWTQGRASQLVLTSANRNYAVSSWRWKYSGHSSDCRRASRRAPILAGRRVAVPATVLWMPAQQAAPALHSAWSGVGRPPISQARSACSRPARRSSVCRGLARFSSLARRDRFNLSSWMTISPRLAVFGWSWSWEMVPLASSRRWKLASTNPFALGQDLIHAPAAENRAVAIQEACRRA